MEKDTPASTGDVWADAGDLEAMVPVEGSRASCPGEKGREGTLCMRG